MAAVSYLIKLSFSDNHGTPWNVTRVRETDDEAIDTAKRALRLHRRVCDHMPEAYDTWTVSKPDHKTGYRIVATGAASDE